MRGVGRLAIAALVATVPAAALAQPAPEPEPEPRPGLVLEGSLGLAVIATDQGTGESISGPGAIAVGHLGGYLTPRTTLFVLVGSAGGDADNDAGEVVSLVEVFLGVGFRFWMTPRLWAEASLATSRFNIQADFDDDVSRPGRRFALEGGYTIYEGQRLNVDTRVGISGSGYRDDVAASSVWLGLGLTNK